MLGFIKNFIGSKLAGGAQVATRQEMLRHTEFYQFGRLVFGKESSPHELHWAIRDALLDGGAVIEGEGLPVPSTHWAMTPAELVGKNTGCEADYMPFSGSLKASRGKALPKWFWPVVILGLITSIFIIGLFVLAGCVLYRYIITTYHRGTILARYDGVYRRPATGAETAAGVKNWEFQVDVMVSYMVEAPPFGLTAAGPGVVQPVYAHAINNLVELAKTGVRGARTQPQLVSRLSSAYEDRFPLQRHDGASGGAIAAPPAQQSAPSTGEGAEYSG